MSSYRFSIRKNRPLKPTLGEVQNTNEILANLLAASVDDLDAPVLRSIQSEGQENAVFPVDMSPSGDEMLEAASLKGVDEDSLRKVRFAFRDWRKKAVAVLNTPESLHELGMDAAELNHYLDADNATLFVVPGEFDSLAWRCAMGFEFGNHAINHVSDLTGAYAPRVAPATPINEPSMPSSPPPTPGTPVITAVPWWHGHQHHIGLVFACGFLTASLLGALIFKLSPCDIGSVRAQIDNLIIQVDQRCNTPQSSRP